MLKPTNRTNSKTNAHVLVHFTNKIGVNLDFLAHLLQQYRVVYGRFIFGRAWNWAPFASIDCDVLVRLLLSEDTKTSSNKIECLTFVDLFAHLLFVQNFDRNKCRNSYYTKFNEYIYSVSGWPRMLL